MIDKVQLIKLVIDWLDGDPTGEILTLDATLLGGPGEVIITATKSSVEGVATVYPNGINNGIYKVS